ncbi:protein SIEVE ELEMENT OCCLUSION C-like isoform X2 [Salvia splendens]|uniref:protein SIEVE ELEMENT OCCLUSION C-like isoform X2 n=1 Tax=Salvia splendens TaxID=180675 RepID=UPI001C270533|nr:protein SIEVE ELEMENT OCCLUSION C-like isoform X2 [Salvia splendens]
MSSPTRNVDDFLIREIVLTHDPGDQQQLDPDLLLNLVEAIFSRMTENPIDFDQDTLFDYDLSASKEPVCRTIYKVSNEMLACCVGGEDLHRSTLQILEMLGPFRWDAKMVVALASFVRSYGVFWLVLQLQSENALSLLLAVVRRIPSTVTFMRPRFKALNLLVGTILRLTRLLISYESWSTMHEMVDNQDREITRSRICLACYWICRSLLVCFSQIADLRNFSLESSDRAVVAAWGLYSLGNKLSCFCIDLGECIHRCQQQIERRLYEKLLCVFKEKGDDNQKALRAFFSWQDEFPFKDSSSKKIGILELKSKIVLLLITKPDLLPLDKAYFLVQQTTGAEDCVVLWIPVSSTNGWSSAAKTSFEFFSSRVPWLSVRRPWSLHPAVVSFFRQEWGFGDDPVLVVLNEDGLVSNTNAMDVVWIWGARAFPFTSEREKELWEQANWTVGLLVGGISPLLSQWIEQGRNLCIYGSDNIDWIRNFSKKIKKIRALGFDLEAVYVGCKNPGENVRNIMHTIDQEDLSSSITFSSVDFFWFRLETLKISIGQQGQAGRCDEIEARVGELLDSGSKDGWGVIGKGWSKDVVMLEQGVLEQGLEALQMWRGNETVTGLAGALRAALEGPGDGRGCRHDEVVEYEEGLAEKTKICGQCRVPMEKFVVYKCEA